MQRIEERLLCRAVTDAVRMACHGDVAGGFQCLTSGLSRVRALAAKGEPWAGELARSYSSALGYYTMLHCGAVQRTRKCRATPAQLAWHRRYAN